VGINEVAGTEEDPEADLDYCESEDESDKEEEKVLSIRQIILLDLNSALVSTGTRDSERKIKILGIFRDMGESREALQAV